MINLFMKFSLRLLYLYLFSFVGLIIVVVGSIQLINLGMRVFIFKDIDRYEVAPMTFPEKEGLVGQPESAEQAQARQDRETDRQRKRDLVNSVSMIAVGLPLYMYHWKIIQNGG